MADNKKLDRIVDRTAERLSKELERMYWDLYENDANDAASAAFECVLITLKQRQPDLMGWMEWGMSNFLAEIQRRAELEVPTQTADGATIH
jgi:hypothetical protein